MMCSECLQLAPKTLAQLDNRLKNIALGRPDVSIHPCSKCKGIEYITSYAVIGKSMTQDQIILLLDLKDSKERGAASMSCGTRTKIARELVKLKLVGSTGFMAISNFYHITDKGLKALDHIGLLHHR